MSVFGGSTLGDLRLDKRLVAYAAAQAENPMGSTASVFDGDDAGREGAYRLLENERVCPSDIDAGPFAATAGACQGRPRVLAIQDTSSVGFGSHLLSAEVAEVGSPTGYVVHSVLMADGDDGQVLGLVEQLRWLRKGRGKRVSSVKESKKWQIADEAMRVRIGDTSNIVNVADREADLYEFVRYHIERGHRFVIRAKVNRQLKQDLDLLLDAAAKAPIVGHRKILIEQRGTQLKKGITPGRTGRKRREVITVLQARSVAFMAPTTGMPALTLNVVRVTPEANDDTSEQNGEFQWVLLTNEPIDSFANVERVVRDYEYRWLIEEFHKCWKTGCRMETRPLQSFEAVERLMAITAPIGVRLLQLQTAARSDTPVDAVAHLSEDEIRCLWSATEKTPFPKKAPSAFWALHAVAKLGGWYNSKRTGRIGWTTLWRGWSRFQERLAGWTAARMTFSSA